MSAYSVTTLREAAVLAETKLVLAQANLAFIADCRAASCSGVLDGAVDYALDSVISAETLAGEIDRILVDTLKRNGITP